MFQDATVDLDWYHNPTGEAGADLFASFVAAYVDVNPRTGCVDCWEDNFAHRNQTFIEEKNLVFGGFLCLARANSTLAATMIEQVFSPER